VFFENKYANKKINQNIVNIKIFRSNKKLRKNDRELMCARVYVKNTATYAFPILNSLFHDGREIANLENKTTG